MRMSTSLLALCCQSAPKPTWETPMRARSRSEASRSLRKSPLFLARFTSPSMAFMKPGGASGNGIESGGNDVLGRDVFDQKQHPGSKGFEGRQGLGKAGSGSGQLLHFLVVNTFDQVVARREMAVQGACSDAGLLCDFVEAGIGALPGKGILGDFKNAVAVSQGVCARFSGGRGWFPGHRQNSCIRRVSPVIYSSGGSLHFS